MVLLKDGRVLRDGRPSEVLFDGEAMADSGVSSPQLVRLGELLETASAAPMRALTVDDAERGIRRLLGGSEGRGRG